MAAQELHYSASEHCARVQPRVVIDVVVVVAGVVAAVVAESTAIVDVVVEVVDAGANNAVVVVNVVVASAAVVGFVVASAAAFDVASAAAVVVVAALLLRNDAVLEWRSNFPAVHSTKPEVEGADEHRILGFAERLEGSQMEMLPFYCHQKTIAECHSCKRQSIMHQRSD